MPKSKIPRIVVGSISDMKHIFSLFNVKLPVIDYPEESKPFFGRRM